MFPFKMSWTSKAEQYPVVSGACVTGPVRECFVFCVCTGKTIISDICYSLYSHLCVEEMLIAKAFYSIVTRNNERC